MNYQLLCQWLNLPGQNWPPDHHALLGISPEEKDPQKIEQIVQDQLAKLRCYQISHPEEATEGMNRLALAFVCLTESLPKPDPRKQAPHGKAPVSQSMVDTVVEGKKMGDWRETAPPVRQTPVEVEVPSSSPRVENSNVVTVVLQDPVQELIRESMEANSGIGTLESLIERIYLNRRVMVAWDQLGKYLQDSKRNLARNEEGDFSRRMKRIHSLMKTFPDILGKPGTPGYRVVAMALLDMTALMFKSMDVFHRDLLAHDWMEGRRVLLAYRKFLHERFKKLRRRGKILLIGHAIRAIINDHPFLVGFSILLLVTLGFGLIFRRP